MSLAEDVEEALMSELWHLRTSRYQADGTVESICGRMVDSAKTYHYSIGFPPTSPYHYSGKAGTPVGLRPCTNCLRLNPVGT